MTSDFKGLINYYILSEDKKPIPISFEEYLNYAIDAELFEQMKRVALDEIGDYRVSTVFLMIDHNFMSGGRPVLFETMIFGGLGEMFCERYCTYEEAVAGHNKVVEALKSGKTPEELNQNDEP